MCFVEPFAHVQQENRFTLFFHPQYNLKTWQLCGFEAAIRNMDYRNTIHNADKFVPQTEQIAELNLWAFKQVCEYQMARQTQRRTLFPITVNIPFSTLSNPYAVYDLAMLRQTYPIPSRAVRLALPSTASYSDAHNIIKGLAYLRAQGLKIVLNYVRTDLTKFSLFGEAVFDQVVLDQCFITKSVKHARVHEILKNNVGLCDRLNIQVACNGIDSLLDLEYAQKIGCITGQGIFFSAPVTSEALCTCHQW